MMKSRKILSILIELFCVASVLIPTHWLNKAIFVLIGIVFLALGRRTYQTISPIIVGLIFLYGAFIAVLSDAPHENVGKWLLTVVVLFLIYPILDSGTDFRSIMRRVGVALAGFTLCIYAFDVTGVANHLPFDFWDVLWRYSLAVKAVKSYFVVDFTSYSIGATPFLIISSLLVAYEIGFRGVTGRMRVLRYVELLLMLSAIALSGSRGVVITTWMGLMCMMFVRVGVVGRILLVMIGVGVNAAVVKMAIDESSLFSMEDFSNQVKVGHVLSYIDHTNTFNALWGEGLGAMYYSSGYGGMVSHTEVTPLDMVRYFGAVAACVLYFMILVPTVDLRKYAGKGLLISLFVLYTINSVSNPTMFNSAGLLIVLWYWYEVLAPRNPRPAPHVGPAPASRARRPAHPAVEPAA